MSSYKIHAALLTCSLTACGKSDSQIVDDICALSLTCLIDDAMIEEYQAELDEALATCETYYSDVLRDADDQPCHQQIRDFVICVSNLSCSDVQEVGFMAAVVDRCEREMSDFQDCDSAN